MPFVNLEVVLINFPNFSKTFFEYFHSYLENTFLNCLTILLKFTYFYGLFLFSIFVSIIKFEHVLIRFWTSGLVFEPLLCNRCHSESLPTLTARLPAQDTSCNSRTCKMSENPSVPGSFNRVSFDWWPSALYHSFLFSSNFSYFWTIVFYPYLHSLIVLKIFLRFLKNK